MKIETKDCPFCGAKVCAFRATNSKGKIIVQAYCENCSASTPLCEDEQIAAIILDEWTNLWSDMKQRYGVGYDRGDNNA